MTTASPPAPSAQLLFFSRLQQLQSRSRTGRISTWPFKVAREKGHGDDDDSNAKEDVRVQAARIIRTTAEHWWPSAS
ncbi:hypothetical protein [Variovorax sp. GB1P17]|uniref:hypothetical protein n=1 Tax=Variovorax sp. GB1P17 TaxID=3443740 RepID=UPI003F48C2A3